MIIHGREVKFFRSVEANCKILQLAPGGSIERFNTEVLGSDDYEKSQRACATMMAIMSEAAELAAHYTDPDYEMNPLTQAEAMSLSSEDFSKAFTEALMAWSGEKPTVVAEPKKKDKPETK